MASIISNMTGILTATPVNSTGSCQIKGLSG